MHYVWHFVGQKELATVLAGACKQALKQTIRAIDIISRLDTSKHRPVINFLTLHHDIYYYTHSQHTTNTPILQRARYIIEHPIVQITRFQTMFALDM